MTLYLAYEVINNAFADLSSIEHKNDDILNGSYSNASAWTLILPSHRQRKHNSTTGSLQEYGEGGLSVEVPNNRPLIDYNSSKNCCTWDIRVSYCCGMYVSKYL